MDEETLGQIAYWLEELCDRLKKHEKILKEIKEIMENENNM